MKAIDEAKRKFRELLAEKGFEMTPEEAKKVYSMAVKIKKRAKRLSTQDLWDIEDEDKSDLSREERVQIANLYRFAKEI